MLSYIGIYYYLRIKKIFGDSTTSCVKLAKEICFRSEQRDQWEESIQISTRGRTIRMCTWKACDSFSSELTRLESSRIEYGIF